MHRPMERGVARLLAVGALLLLGFTAACSSSGVADEDERTIAAPSVRARGRDQIAAAAASARAGRIDDALMTLKPLLDERPLFVEAHRFAQNLRFNRFEDELLAREYDRILAEDQRSGAAHYLVGRIQFSIEARLSAFRRARELAPRLPWGSLGLAAINESVGKFDEARALAEEALRAEPWLPPAFMILARVAVQKGDLKLASSYVGAAEEDETLEEDAARLRAAIAGLRGAVADRIVHLKRAAASARSELALADLGRLAEDGYGGPAGELALSAVESLKDAGVHGGDIDTILARIYRKRGDHERAERAARAAWESGADSRSNLTILRSVAARRGDFAASTRLWLEFSGVSEKDLSEPAQRLMRTARRLPADREISAWTWRDRADMIEALDEAGWTEDAWTFARSIDGRSPRAEIAADADLGRYLAVRTGLEAHRRLLKTLELRKVEAEAFAERSNGVQMSLAAFIDRIVKDVHATTGHDVSRGNEIYSVPFLGTMLRMDRIVEGGLVDYFLKRNQAIFIGQFEGRPPAALLMTLVTTPRSVPVPGTDGAWAVEYAGDDVIFRPLEEGGGEVAGRALYGCYYLDFDSLAPSRLRLEKVLGDLPAATARRLLESRGLEATSPEERMSVDRPLDMATTLLLRAVALDGGPRYLDIVRTHELGHVADALHHLPFWDNFLDNLALGFIGGFSAFGVMSRLEESAQEFALVHSPSPHLVLHDILRHFPSGVTKQTHADGYRRLLERFIGALERRRAEFPTIRDDHVLLHQLHFLSPDEIRRIARDL